MQQVQCPHCRNVLVDDGQLAGQLVACPQCGGQFQMSGWSQQPPPIHVAAPSPSVSLPSSYRSTGRKQSPKTDQSVLVMLGLLGVVVLAGGGIAFALMQRPESTPISERPASSKKASNVRADSQKTDTIDLETQRTNSAAQHAESERREREIERLREETRLANENAKLRIDEEVRRQLDDKRQQRETRLAALAQRERNEIPPIESEIEEIQVKIATGDKNMARMRAQMQSLPQSSGIPGGTRFQPTIPRETRDVELQGMQRWQKLQADFEKLRAELVSKLRSAEQRLQQKQSELERERQKILADL